MGAPAYPTIWCCRFKPGGSGVTKDLVKVSAEKAHSWGSGLETGRGSADGIAASATAASKSKVGVGGSEANEASLAARRRVLLRHQRGCVCGGQLRTADTYIIES